MTVPDSVPGPPEVGVPEVIDTVTALVSPVTVLPVESWILTTGCVAKTVPAVVVALGEVVKASLFATPMTENAALVPAVSASPEVRVATSVTLVSPAVFV